MSKLVRLVDLLDRTPELNSLRPYPFLLVDGLIGDLTPWMLAGGHGTTSGIPNFAPHATVRLYNLRSQSSLSSEKQAEAKRLQAVLSRADADAVPGGIRAMSESPQRTRLSPEYALHHLRGYSIWPRKPLLPLNTPQGDIFMKVIADMVDLEKEYAS